MNGILPILKWYKKNKRDLPWRNTQDPYLIWISEVILQQTRVEQGLPYYQNFASKYPTVKKLAAAKDNEVMKLWQGLGYYNRAKNMLKTARVIASDYKGNFPKTYSELILLKGIGPYTAAAISSFAHNEAKAVVDGNVYRVLSRVFGISEAINGTLGKKIFAEIAQETLDTNQSGMYNQAIMELGATICKPTSPKCEECPVMFECHAYKNKTISAFPVKLKKQKSKERFLHFFFIDKKGKTFIRQRKHERIWHQLFEPPYIETEKPNEELNIINNSSLQLMFSTDVNTVFKKALFIKHQLTHQNIHATFWEVTPSKSFEILDNSYIEIKISDLPKYAVHRLFDKFLNYRNLQKN